MNFLPLDLNPLLTGTQISQMTSVYNVPMWHCLKLLRVSLILFNFIDFYGIYLILLKEEEVKSNHKLLNVLTLKCRVQFLYHYINIIARPIYGDAVI